MREISNQMNTDTNSEKTFHEWAKVELMGHNVMIGLVTEAPIAGVVFLRVDVPERNGLPGFTRFINPSSIYAINPISEAIAIALIGRCSYAPPQIEGPTENSASTHEDDHEDWNDDGEHLF